MAMILDGFLSQFGESLGSLVKEEVVMLWGVKHGIESLQKKLQKIENVLEDAEKRRIKDKNVNLWLMELRDVMYELDDVIDECSFERKKQKRKLQHQTSSLGKLVRCCLPLTSSCHNLVFYHKVGRRIKNINVKLDEISKDKDQFNFAIGHENAQNTNHQYNRATSPMTHNEVLGIQIEDDTKKFVDLLVQNNESKRCITFGIVGMGGIGKTTLAQKIFNDEIIESNFHVRVWVCVSQDYNELDILKQIIRQVGGSYHLEATKAELDPILCKCVEHKRLLLVVDDVWDAQVWDQIGALVNNCEFGSRVLVTSRDEIVVRQIGVTHPHKVKRLPVEDGWLILYRKVFCGRDDETKAKAESLKEMGVKIVEKCDGHPLAIQVVGGILSMIDASEMKWMEVLDKLGHRTWSPSRFQGKEAEIMNVMYLSYQDLSTPLKQCFLSFSLFPAVSIIRRRDVCALWISEGFIKAEGGMSLEEVTIGYYTELVTRNLIQLEPGTYHDYLCKMHDLLWSLARLLVMEENYCGDVQSLENLSCRRISIIDEVLNDFPESLKERKHLRVLMLIAAPRLFMWDVPMDLFTNLRRLRVLNLRKTKIIRLPKSVGNLIHLRFLDVSETDLEQVPEVIGRLINLQFLALEKCRKLHSLPRGITNLDSLRMLDIQGSPVDYLPKGIGGLQNLRNLADFVVGEGSWDRRRGVSSSSLKELKNLSQIRVLSISRLERVQSSGEARGAELRKKLHLWSLQLQCTIISVDGDGDEILQYEGQEVERIEEVFNELCPPPCISQITLIGFFGSKFPSWLGHSSEIHLPNLTRLVLLRCVHCTQLPALGQLPQLDYLHLAGALAIVSIGPELLISQDDGGGVNPFPKLRKLIMEGMPNWEEWCGVEAGALQLLESLEIKKCPKLGSLPDGLRHASNLTELQITDCPRLENISNLPMLEDLSIVDCPSLNNLPNSLGALRHLQLGLDLREEMLPEWFQHENLCSLQKFELACGFELLKKLLPKVANGEGEDGVEWHKIQHVPHVLAEDGSDGSNYYFSYTKEPFSFNTNLSR